MSSISLEGGRSKDIVRLCRLSSHFKNFSHQKLFFDLKDKNYKKAKMKGGLGWMTIIWNDSPSLFNGNHFSSIYIIIYMRFSIEQTGECLARFARSPIMYIYVRTYVSNMRARVSDSR